VRHVGLGVEAFDPAHDQPAETRADAVDTVLLESTGIVARTAASNVCLKIHTEFFIAERFALVTGALALAALLFAFAHNAALSAVAAVQLKIGADLAVVDQAQLFGITLADAAAIDADLSANARQFATTAVCRVREDVDALLATEVLSLHAVAHPLAADLTSRTDEPALVAVVRITR
jgi:hypothetical protein